MSSWAPWEAMQARLLLVLAKAEETRELTSLRVAELADDSVLALSVFMILWLRERLLGARASLRAGSWFPRLPMTQLM